jgi:phospholipid-transporting ATPase
VLNNDLEIFIIDEKRTADIHK